MSPLMLRALESNVSHILAFGLRIGPVRRLLARFRLPRPEHLERLSTGEFRDYVRALGIDADARAALAEYLGERHPGQEARFRS